jgi:acyl-CoA synthetase (AMP-forming)/AMP-acid ligase II
MTEILPIAMVDGRLKASHGTIGDLLGRPVDSINIKIANDGELIVSGPHMCEKYLGKTGILKEILTGDIVKIEKGNIVMMGRKKDMILRGDYNIYPAVFEPIIESIPGVKACAMIGIFNPVKFDEEIFLIVEPNRLANIGASYIFNQIKSGKYSIDTHAFPDHILFMELPRSGRQLKVNKLALRELISENAK